ncbi:MAG: hypothetical protein Q7J38_09675 [Gallionella sp.]|nr:hypothetical protein [Gallionella sp.]
MERQSFVAVLRANSQSLSQNFASACGYNGRDFGVCPWGRQINQWLAEMQAIFISACPTFVKPTCAYRHCKNPTLDRAFGIHSFAARIADFTQRHHYRAEVFLREHP